MRLISWTLRSGSEHLQIYFWRHTSYCTEKSIIHSFTLYFTFFIVQNNRKLQEKTFKLLMILGLTRFISPVDKKFEILVFLKHYEIKAYYELIDRKGKCCIYRK
jgi:hypothetical protein